MPAQRRSIARNIKNQSLILFHRGEIKAKQDGALKIRNITKL